MFSIHYSWPTWNKTDRSRPEGSPEISHSRRHNNEEYCGWKWVVVVVIFKNFSNQNELQDAYNVVVKVLIERYAFLRPEQIRYFLVVFHYNHQLALNQFLYQKLTLSRFSRQTAPLQINMPQIYSETSSIDAIFQWFIEFPVYNSQYCIPLILKGWRIGRTNKFGYEWSGQSIKMEQLVTFIYLYCLPLVSVNLLKPYRSGNENIPDAVDYSKYLRKTPFLHLKYFVLYRIIPAVGACPSRYIFGFFGASGIKKKTQSILYSITALDFQCIFAHSAEEAIPLFRTTYIQIREVNP